MRTRSVTSSTFAVRTDCYSAMQNPRYKMPPTRANWVADSSRHAGNRIFICRLVAKRSAAQRKLVTMRKLTLRRGASTNFHAHVPAMRREA